MARKFADLAAEQQAGWNDDSRKLYEAASTLFERERQEMERLGAELRAARHRKDLSQLALAALAGVQQAEISRIERGLSNPTESTLIKLTGALDVRLAVTDQPVAS